MEGSSEGLRGEVGSSFQVVGNAWVLGRIWAGLGRVLGASWAAPGHLGRLLGSSRAAPGRSWAVLGTLGRLLGYLGQLLGALGRLWSDLGREAGAKLDAKMRKQESKIPQNRSQHGPRWA